MTTGVPRQQGVRSKSKALIHVKRFGTTFGLYQWKRNRTAGWVARVGPLGHVQLQVFRMRLVGKQADGRRGKHGVKLSCWGVRGRRRKKSIELSVDL